MFEITTSPLAWLVAVLNLLCVLIAIIGSARLVFSKKERAWLPIFLATLLAYGLSYLATARSGRIPAVPYQRVEMVESSTGPIRSIDLRYSLDLIALGTACGSVIALRRK